MIFRSSHPDVFLGKDVLKICSKFTGKHSCRSAILIKLLCNITEITLQRGCPPVHLLHIFRAAFPKDTSGRVCMDLRQRWIRFVNRESWKPSKKSCICRKHCEPHYYKSRTKGKRYKLIKKLKPVPTIFDSEQSHLSAESKVLKLPISVPRKSRTKRVYQQDQFKLFEEQDNIKSFDDIGSTLTPPWYTFQKYDNHAVFYHLENNVLNVLETTDCVRVDQNLHVKLFYKGSLLPLPQWLRNGRDCRLTRKVMMQNIPNYSKLEGEQTFSILEELKDFIFKKKIIFSSNVIRYSVLLRYTSLQTYQLLMTEFQFSSLSLVKKITEGQLDAVN